MFERFTNDAREVVRISQDECRALGHQSIGTVHLLLAVSVGEGAGARALREHGIEPTGLRARIRRMTGPGGDPIDGAALATIGIDLEEVRRAVEATFGEGALEGRHAVRGHIPFTVQAKKALEMSVRSAATLKHKYICSGHVLLGLLRSGGADNLALLILTEANADPDVLAATVTRIIQSNAA
jgi:ATP-dependent Clp protease ATP-binding subunit ClpA